MAKIIREDGHITYYYYKKKRGRPKKRGAKKRKKIRGRRWQEKWNFKILKFDFKKQSDYIGIYHDIEEVGRVIESLKHSNSKVVFPIKYASKKNPTNKPIPYESEYVILKRVDENTEKKPTRLRNEFGKFIENDVSSKDWIIYDKIECLKEETFWVYGYHPRTDRKTFEWIYDNLIYSKVNGTYDFVWVYCYNNKLILMQDNDNFDFVICKNTSDCIRMYNMIEERKKKNKQIVMAGFTNKNKDRAKETVAMIQEKTGWDLRKIHKTTTMG